MPDKPDFVFTRDGECDIRRPTDEGMKLMRGEEYRKFSREWAEASMLALEG